MADQHFVDLDAASEALEILQTAFKRFTELDEKPMGLTRSERIEYDTLGGLLCDVRKFGDLLTHFSTT